MTPIWQCKPISRAKISPLLYGIFFEEINRAGDGGLYAEMLQNRSFEDAADRLAGRCSKWPAMTWSMALDTARPLNANNRTSLKLAIAKAAGRVGILTGFKGVRYDRRDEPKAFTSGFWGPPASQNCGLFVEKGKEYRFIAYVRSEDFTARLR